MTSISQKNLISLARQNERSGKLSAAIQNLEEALRLGRDCQLVVELSGLYRMNHQEDQAYALLKEEPDLFSNQELFKEYQLTLAANNFAIEAAQLEYLRQEKLSVLVEPVKEDKQQSIMNSFKHKTEVTQYDYQQLLKLNQLNFQDFAQSLLLDPSQNFAVRLSLCEDLVKLGVAAKIKIWVLGEKHEFIPQATQLLEKETIYQEVVAAISDRLRHNPSQLPLFLGEINIALGSIYPLLSRYISNPDSFARNFYSFLQTHQGYEDHKLLEKIYQHVPH